MKFLRKIYLILKKVPGLGYFLVRIRNILYGNFVQRFFLQRRDFKEVEIVITNLFKNDKAVFSYLRQFKKSAVFKKDFSFGHSGDFDGAILYVLVRKLKPEIVMETGVASGRSSTIILQALRDNNKGKLTSIDLPYFYEGDEPGFYKSDEGKDVLCGYVPKGKEPGWLVPEKLRDRWDLILGDSKVKLPNTVEQLKKIDIFYHDSDHSYDYMMFEFDAVWDKIKPTGFLLADDISWNKAFDDFANKVDYDYIHKYRNFGILRKK